MKRKNYIIHPYNIGLIAVLCSITALFLGFSAAYIYSRIQGKLEVVALPWLFYFNVCFLIGGSWVLQKARKNFVDDDAKMLMRNLWLALTLSVLFLCLQVLAWVQLFRHHLPLDHSITTSYLYILSGLHFLHVLAGIPFLFRFTLNTKNRISDLVSGLLYFSDSHQRLSLNLLTWYWHFLDVLWIYLLLFFTYNYYSSY